MAAYCTTGDLLVGDLGMGDMNPDTFIANAADEMHARLGMTYVVPFVTAGMSVRDVALLKHINTLLASGRLLQAASQDLDSANYGQSLIREAHDLMAQLANGMLILSSAESTETDLTSDFVPIAIPGDEVSGVESIYDLLMNPSTTYVGWKPGSAWGT